ncbi:epoxide hydrolase, soluble (sEH) [Coemansia sp. RSA 989]|nr:epoxide hydrolase, soluble (sEH) [Coemansia sp. RSA 989]
MDQDQSIPVNHDDFIHDIAYNFYGTRLATCGSDRCIKIWDWNRQTGLWILNESISAHDSSVVRLSWAHPEFGQVLASCSLDCTVRIWVEQETNLKNSGTRWRGLTPLTDSKAAVHSIAFAPEYTSLSIATASSDGKVRLYSPTDSVRLENWTVNCFIDFVPGGATDADGPLSVSWCKSRFSSPHMLVVGGSRHKNVKIFQLLNNAFVELAELAQYDSHVLDVDWAPTMGRSYHLIATACADGHIRIYKFWSDPELAGTRLTGSLFVRDGDDDDDGDEEARDQPRDDASDDDSISDDSISDDDDDDDSDDSDASVSGGGGGGGDEGDAESEGSDAAATGSVFGGTAGQKRRTRATAAAAAAAAAAATAAGPRSELVSDISVQPSVPIRRIRWNSTGTLLVSSSDDGVVRMWRMTPSGTWREMAAVSAESA